MSDTPSSPNRQNPSASEPGRLIHGAYYPHIDGIRALAVLPVVAYHVLASLCPGGFAGVDVFFVISGYLITGNILRDLRKNEFTIRNFYHRRIRRIYAASFVCIAGVFVAGCAIYYCMPLKRLGDASVMSSLFAANFYFREELGDYFTPAAHGNPLLHLWSLSVEEQFYLFIPVLCAVVWKFRRPWVAPTLATLGVISFGASVAAVATGRDADAFYFLHFRAWELLAGCLLATLPALPSLSPRQPAVAQEGSGPGSERGAPPGRPTRHGLLAAAGLLLVLVPYGVLSSTTPFPGATALPSVMGTVLLIRYGQSPWANRLLSASPLVFVGKISYSLYLWHWPVTVFWRYLTYDQLYGWDYAGMALLSFLLAYLSWRFVELPVRTSPRWTMRRSFAYAAAGTVLLVTVGAATALNRGWPDVLHREANALVADVNIQAPSFIEERLGKWFERKQKRAGPGPAAANVARWRFDAGRSGDFLLGEAKEPELLLLGDSHSASLRYGLDVCLREQGRAGLAISESATHMFNLSDPHVQKAMRELDKRPSVSRVLLAQFWSNTGATRRGEVSRDEMAPRLEEFAVQIKARGKTLFVLADWPAFSRTASRDELARVAIMAPRTAEPGWDGRQAESQYDQEQRAVNEELQAVCRRTGAVFVPMHLAFRERDGYTAFESRDGKRIPLYRDGSHLCPAGAVRASRFIMPYLFAAPPGPTTRGAAED